LTVAVDRVAVDEGFGKRMEGIGRVLREIRMVDDKRRMAVAVATAVTVTTSVATVAVD
jgi:hypothetical protein